MAIGTVRYWAAAKDAAGRAEEPYEAETLAGVLAAVRARYSGRPAFGAVLDRSSFLVDGAPVGRRAPADVPLRDGDVIEVLPPFAGG